jgi:acylpyruvate hydrolase
VRLATVRRGRRTNAAVIDGETARLLDVADVGQLLASRRDWQSHLPPAVDEAPVDSLEYAPLVLSPPKIICVGLNYRTHIEEMGMLAPECPTLFAKFSRSLLGARDPVALPSHSHLDWEAELVAVVGAPIRQATVQQAAEGICGFTVGNDVTDRIAQFRTSQWLPGKTLEHTTPVGPHLVTIDETGSDPDLAISCQVDGVMKQASRTSDMLFSASEVLAHISEFVTAEPGDLVFMGTPSGVGNGRTPEEYLRDGSVIVTEIEMLGVLINECRAVDANSPMNGQGRPLTTELAG